MLRNLKAWHERKERQKCLQNYLEWRERKKWVESLHEETLSTKIKERQQKKVLKTCETMLQLWRTWLGSEGKRLVKEILPHLTRKEIRKIWIYVNPLSSVRPTIVLKYFFLLLNPLQTFLVPFNKFFWLYWADTNKWRHQWKLATKRRHLQDLWLDRITCY